MTDTNIMFSRLFLEQVMNDVQEVGIKDARKAWVWTSDRRGWEFHYGEFYAYFRASNAYEARAKGWDEYLKEKGL